MRDVDFGGSARCERRSTRVARLVLEAVGRVPVGEVVTLQFDKLRFKLQLYLRHKDKSNLILYTDIIGDLEALRLERIQRALDDKCKKLESWAAKKDGHRFLRWSRTTSIVECFRDQRRRASRT